VIVPDIQILLVGFCFGGRERPLDIRVWCCGSSLGVVSSFCGIFLVQWRLTSDDRKTVMAIGHLRMHRDSNNSFITQKSPARWRRNNNDNLRESADLRRAKAVRPMIGKKPQDSFYGRMTQNRNLRG
jgi:hypothetical protein